MNSFRIGELARRSGLTADALRYYERLGLIPPPKRTSGGFRVYPPDTLDRIRFIKQAQTVGLTLREVGALLHQQAQRGSRRCRQVRDVLRSRLREVEAHIRELQAFRTTLSGYLRQCERALAEAGPADDDLCCPVIETLSPKQH